MKKDLINEMLRLTKLQTAALEDDNIDEFTSLMEKKQICIDKINEMTNNNPAVLDEDDRVILLQTVEVDKKNREEFNTQFEEVKLQLRKIRSLKKRDAFYSNPYDVSAEEGMFIDKK